MQGYGSAKTTETWYQDHSKILMVVLINKYVYQSFKPFPLIPSPKQGLGLHDRGG